MKNYDPSDYDKPPFFRYLRAKIAEKIVSKFPKKVSSVLDLGCGSGKQTNLYTTDWYVGVDLNPDMLCAASMKATEKKTNYSFIRDDVEFYQDIRKFKVVNCCSMLYHIEDIPRFLKKLDYWCQADGYIVLETDNPKAIFDRFWNWVYGGPEEMDYDPDELNYEYTLNDLRLFFSVYDYDIKVYGINFLTGLVPYFKSCSLKCPRALKYIFNALTLFDPARFFPSLSSNFIIIAHKKPVNSFEEFKQRWANKIATAGKTSI